MSIAIFLPAVACRPITPGPCSQPTITSPSAAPTAGCDSAGIGKALAKKLASQGLNVVLVALPDQLLQDTYAELTRSHPAVKFRAVLPNPKTAVLSHTSQQIPITCASMQTAAALSVRRLRPLCAGGSKSWQAWLPSTNCRGHSRHQCADSGLQRRLHDHRLF